MKKIQEKHEKENTNVEFISYRIQDIYQLKEEQSNLYRIEQQVEDKILNKKR